VVMKVNERRCAVGHIVYSHSIVPGGLLVMS
jgi:hypothetical protein